MHKQPILELTEIQVEDWLRAQGQPAMRARQIRRWLLGARAESFAAMTDLPIALRDALAARFQVFETTIAHHGSSSDQTHKLLLKLGDGQSVECVLIQEAGRHTACVSTQVGCGMGCVFCASGLDGLARNLSTAEIVEQLLRLRNLLPGDERLDHVVVMGMGEPLANLDGLLPALALAGARDGLNIGARHVTISTVGLPAKIRRLADVGKQYHLAVSLHAPNDFLRSRIVPTNAQTGIREILAAADYFFERTGRRVTYEYVLLKGLNDQSEQALQLAALLRGRCAHLNLIPFNDVEGLVYKGPTMDALAAFIDLIQNAGISVKVRKRKGSSIDAACGQLRRRVQAPDSAVESLAHTITPLTVV